MRKAELIDSKTEKPQLGGPAYSEAVRMEHPRKYFSLASSNCFALIVVRVLKRPRFMYIAPLFVQFHYPGDRYELYFGSS